MPTWTEVAKNNSIPYDIPTTTGDLTRAGDVGDISRQGTFKQTNALPGSPDNLPTTYSAPGEGTVQKPYKTVDVEATKVPNNQLSGTPESGSLKGASNGGYLPSSVDNPAPRTGSTLPGINGHGLQGSRDIKGLPVFPSGGAVPSGAASTTAESVLGKSLGRAVDAAAVPLGLASKFLKRLSPLGSLLDIADFFRGDDLADEEAGLAAANSREASKKQLEKNRKNRKGNKNPKMPPSDGRKPKPLDPTKSYFVYWTQTVTLGDQTLPGQPRLNGVSGATGVKFTFSEQEVYLNGQPVSNTRGTPYIIKSATVDNITEVNGKPIPYTDKPEPQANGDGFPTPQSLIFPETNSSPTATPAAAPRPASEPTSQKSPQADPGIKPGKNPETQPKPTKEPETPSLPNFIPIPLPIPSANPSPTSNPAPSANVQAPPLPGLNPTSTTSTTPKTDPFTETPGLREQPKPLPETKSPTPNTDPEDGKRCCPKTDADLSEIKRVLGVGEFPATLPILTGDETRIINNIPDLLLWNTSNTDAVAGLFPATVRVEQPDSTVKEIKLQNMAHAMEELFAAVLTVAEDADAAVNIAARIATEIVQTKIATHQGNDLLKAMQKFLGFGVTPFPRVIKLNFSPTAVGTNGKLENDEMEGFLKPSTQNYVGTELSEKQEILPMMQRILRNSEIAMRAVWQPIKPGKKGEDSITGTSLRDSKKKPSPQEKKQWEDYLKILKDAGFEVDDNSPSKGK